MFIDFRYATISHSLPSFSPLSLFLFLVTSADKRSPTLGRSRSILDWYLCQYISGLIEYKYTNGNAYGVGAIVLLPTHQAQPNKMCEKQIQNHLLCTGFADKNTKDRKRIHHHKMEEKVFFFTTIVFRLHLFPSSHSTIFRFEFGSNRRGYVSNH